MYNFDEIIDRKATGCVKYDALEEFGLPSDTMALWVADMDFRTPDFILDALRKRLDHPVLGYGLVPKDYFPTIARWIENLHGWKVDPDNIRYIPGIVKGIGLALRALVPEGAKVIIMTPVYHPFRFVPQRSGYEVVYNPLLPVFAKEDVDLDINDRKLIGYDIDFKGLEELMKEGAEALVLANPHNPGGLVWDPGDLRKIAALAKEYGVLVISDEIHGEMVLDGRRHTPFASVSKEAEEVSVTFMAPSKTFNIPGIVSSYVIVNNEVLRNKFFKYLESCEMDAPSIFATVATMAAYTEGEEWRKEMLGYVSANLDFLEEYLGNEMPAADAGNGRKVPVIRALRPEASFLVWLDCRSLRLPQSELTELFERRAGLFLNDGSMFESIAPDGTHLNTEGQGFMRLNIACPRSVLKKALEKLKNAL